MGKIIRIIWIGVIGAFCLSSSVSCTSWFYNAPRALLGLLGSASASASAPTTPMSFIADLRKKEAKSAQLQENQDAVGLEPLPENGGDLESSGDGSNEGTTNEASPSLLQKKIGKILAKLRLIAQIKNAYHYRPEVHEHDTNITITSQETPVNTTETQKTPNSTISTGVGRKENLTVDVKSQWENIQQIPPVTGPYGIQKNPAVFRKNDDKPTKIEIDVNQIRDKPEIDKEKSGKLKEHEPGRLGALGVFFAELVGSIVGLTYGAVAQFASGGQNPVTISTSEGL